VREGCGAPTSSVLLRVDVRLAAAGWAKASRRVVDEFFLAGDSAVRAESKFPEPRGFADSALLLPDGRPIALVEVKRFSRDPLEGETQASRYADRVKQRCDGDPFLNRVFTKPVFIKVKF
jgi:type I restriction enzyme R subunit